MENVVRLPFRKDFDERERRRIAKVAADAGATLCWHKTYCTAILGERKNGGTTLGTITREQGMVRWYPRDALSPLLAHVSLEAVLMQIRRVL